MGENDSSADSTRSGSPSEVDVPAVALGDSSPRRAEENFFAVGDCAEFVKISEDKLATEDHLPSEFDVESPTAQALRQGNAKRLQECLRAAVGSRDRLVFQTVMAETVQGILTRNLLKRSQEILAAVLNVGFTGKRQKRGLTVDAPVARNQNGYLSETMAQVVTKNVRGGQPLKTMVTSENFFSD